MKKKKKRKEVRQMQRALNSLFFFNLINSKSVNFTGFRIKVSFVSKGSESNKRLEDLW